jgi:hypothetical protein
MNPIAVMTRAVWCGLLAIIVATATACSSDQRASGASNVGTVTIPLLTSVGPDTYRLAAVLAVTGAQGVTTLSTTGDEAVLTTTFPAGQYDALLQSFTLLKDDGTGTFHPVTATATSDHQAFTIFAHSTTTISFQFETNGVLVPLGSGNLSVTFGVTEIPDVCTVFGPGCADGSWCAPPALTGQPIACIPAGTTPLGSACASPSECPATATCHDFGRGPVCAALCAPSDFGAPCTTGGSCVQADPAFGLCTPDEACNPITVDRAARTVQSDRFFLDFSNAVAANPEDVDVLRWEGGPNLVESFAIDACTSDAVEHFGNSFEPIPTNHQAIGRVVVGSGSTGSWEQDGASIVIDSTSSGCAASTAVPVETRYQFREGIGADTIQIERKFALGSAPLTQPIRAFIPRLTIAFDRVLHPNAAGTTLLSEDVFACPYGCQLSDWDGSWFAYYASSGSFAGQGMIVRRPPSAVPANLWLDYDAGITDTNSSSALLLPPAGGFPQQLTETELLCFFDATSFTPEQQTALTLPRGCTFDLACSQPPPCQPNPCQHGGTCSAVGDGYTCTCPPGINGKNCDQVFTELEGGLASNCGLRSDGHLACWGPNSVESELPPTDAFKTFSIMTGYLCAVHTGGSAECWQTDDAPAAPQPPDVPFKSLSVTSAGGCGILTNDRISCWGDYDRSFDPPPTGSFQAVSMGVWHVCALGIDQTVTCWLPRGGLDPSLNLGQANPPAGTFLSVRSGSAGTCGLRTDHTIACWGALTNALPLVPPSGTFTALDYRIDFGCAIRTDQTLACWGGSIAPGSVDSGYGEGATTPPSGTYRSISTGYYHPCAVRTDDSVVCWGGIPDVDWEQPPTGQP